MPPIPNTLLNYDLHKRVRLTLSQVFNTLNTTACRTVGVKNGEFKDEGEAPFGFCNTMLKAVNEALF